MKLEAGKFLKSALLGITQVITLNNKKRFTAKMNSTQLAFERHCRQLQILDHKSTSDENKQLTVNLNYVGILYAFLFKKSSV
jgi:hypothetical protein